MIFSVFIPVFSTYRPLYYIFQAKSTFRDKEKDF